VILGVVGGYLILGRENALTSKVCTGCGIILHGRYL